MRTSLLLRPGMTGGGATAGAWRAASFISIAAPTIGPSSLCVSRIARAQAWIVMLQRRWRNIVGTPPDLHLRISELGGRLRLVQKAKRFSILTKLGA